ncbi:MAG: ABC transporter permease [Bacteroidetes bacterium]|nr:ABC transporter permease [Bacteroidota bacterium]
MKKISIKYILRNIWKNKTSSFINVLGLSIGLASSIIVFLFIEFELSFDNYYKNKDQIYRITRTISHASSTNRNGATSFPMAYSLRNDFPDFDFTSIYMSGSQDILSNEKIFRERNILFVDSVFFSVFDLQFIVGSPEVILEHPQNIAITKSVAEKYFGSEDPIGKIITFSPNINYQIVGLIKDQPLNSTLDFSMILSVENLNAETLGFEYDSWSNTISGFECYVKIGENVNLDEFETRMNEVIRKYRNDEYETTHFNFQLLSKMHLEPDYQNLPNTYTTSETSLWIYAFIGILIIAIAGINFINLSMAQGLKRAKEVGVRKVLGASKSQLSFLFIKENAMISIIALVVAVIIVEVVLPYINIFLGNNHQLSIYNSSYFIIYFVAVYVIVNIIIALYPSFVMSRFTPIKALKGKLSNSKQVIFSLRNILLVFQFTVSIALIIATIVIKMQISYVNHKDLGFQIDNVIKFSLPENDSSSVQSLRQFLETMPGVQHFGFGIGSPSSSRNFTTAFTVEGEDESINRLLNFKPADAGYSEVFNLNLLAGKWFDERTKGDSIFRVVVNEKLYKIYGFKNPEDAINKRISFSGTTGIICGVVKDFHTYSLHLEIDPLVFASHPRFYGNMFVKVEPSRLKETITQINQKMSDLYPSYFIESMSVKEELKEMYSEADKAAIIITSLSALAIIIATLGLFGIVSIALVQKVKEIGIRKVLGAELHQIAISLTHIYIKLILAASLIAIPLGWYFMSKWLDGFSYRIEIGIWIFILASFIAFFVALLTIIFQVVKTSRMNPVNALKYE